MKAKCLFENNFNIPKRISSQVKSADCILLLLDYDGTIVPIQKTPDLANLSNSMRKLLISLLSQPNLVTGIVSGRSMKDIKEKVGIPYISYIANHGFEIQSGKFKWQHKILDEIVPINRKLIMLLKQAFRNAEGVIIEDKGITISIHYRNLKGMYIYDLKSIVKKIVIPYSSIIKVSGGKKVIEIKPRINWHKGKAIIELMKLLGLKNSPLIFYFGDDKTDEYAFRTLAANCITVFVGNNRQTNANYYLNDPKEVEIFLRKLNKILEKV